MSNWELTEKAKCYAEIAHKGQVRQLSSEQFMIHPNNVANKLESVGFFYNYRQFVQELERIAH